MTVMTQNCVWAVGILLLFFSTMVFYSGYHNTDLGYNARVFEVAAKANLIDYGTDEIPRAPMEIYRLGMSQLELGLRLMFGAGCFLGVGFVISSRAYSCDASKREEVKKWNTKK